MNVLWKPGTVIANILVYIMTIIAAYGYSKYDTQEYLVLFIVCIVMFIVCTILTGLAFKKTKEV